MAPRRGGDRATRRVRRCGCPTTSSSQREARCSVERRRSPRGQHSTTPAPGGGQDGAQLVVLPGHGLGGQRQAATGAGALAVGQEHVVGRAGGERALGHAEHDDDVEVLAEGEADRADEHAVAQAPDAPEVGVELELERAPEALDGRPGIDGVEAARGGRGRPAPCPPPPARPRATSEPAPVAAEVALHEVVPERGQSGPRGGRGGEPGAQVADEGAQLLGVVGPVLGPLGPVPHHCRRPARRARRRRGATRRRDAAQPLVPLAPPGHDARFAGGALPRTGRHRPAVGGDERRTGQQCEQVVAADVVIGQRQQAEHGARRRRARATAPWPGRCGGGRRRRAARHRGGRRARRWRSRRRSARAARPRGGGQHVAQRRRAPRRRRRRW